METTKPSEQKLPSSIVDAQLQRLLEVVSAYEKQQCEIILKQAQEQAEQVVQHSYHNARKRLREHIDCIGTF